MATKNATQPKYPANVSAALQAALVDLVDLSLVGKQLHWNVYGPNFRSVHLHLDEVVDMARLATDQVAERLVTIGTPADGRAEQVAKESKVKDSGPGPIGDDKVITIMAEELQAVADRIKESLPDLEEPDPLSHDMLITIATDLEMQAWMFRAQQK